VKRIVNGKADYLEEDFQLTPSWADYYAEFTANESAGPVGPVEAGFSVAGGSLLLDDVDLEQTGGDATNRTAFRDEVVQTLKELRPGVLRLMSSHAYLGSTVDNLLAAPLARQRPGFSTWQTTMEDIPIGIPEFLELCREVGAEPWIVAPTAMSGDEARMLAEYLSGDAATAGGAMRAAEGQREPWTRVFKTIHIATKPGMESFKASRWMNLRLTGGGQTGYSACCAGRRAPMPRSSTWWSAARQRTRGEAAKCCARLMRPTRWPLRRT
jgi:hypothetical protein